MSAPRLRTATPDPNPNPNPNPSPAYYRYGLEDHGREWKRPRATTDRLEKERAARGPAAEKAALQVARLEE